MKLLTIFGLSTYIGGLALFVGLLIVVALNWAGVAHVTLSGWLFGLAALLVFVGKSAIAYCARYLAERANG